ncbi:ficolin-2-like isoform X3 [Haemaphysalis longicornis]
MRQQSIMLCHVLFAYVVFVVITSAESTRTSATDVQPSIEQAEELARELTQILDSVKSSILPRHCADLLDAGQRTNGVYTIFHAAAGPSGQTVSCDMETDGGGWTVIQKRGQFKNRVYYFYRNWAQYKVGFGSAAQEYWIGNDALHALTSGNESMAFRVVLINNTHDYALLDYESIRVASEKDLYKIQLGKFLGPNGWDSMEVSNGQSFSTYDRDNDKWSDNCAVTYRGAWWYNRCHSANLNGLNLNGAHDSFADGMDWSLRGYTTPLQYYSYPSALMMIRPAKLLRR